MALYPPTFQSYIGYRAFISFYRKRGTLPLARSYVELKDYKNAAESYEDSAKHYAITELWGEAAFNYEEAATMWASIEQEKNARNCICQGVKCAHQRGAPSCAASILTEFSKNDKIEDLGDYYLQTFREFIKDPQSVSFTRFMLNFSIYCKRHCSEYNSLFKTGIESLIKGCPKEPHANLSNALAVGIEQASDKIYLISDFENLALDIIHSFDHIHYRSMSGGMKIWTIGMDWKKPIIVQIHCISDEPIVDRIAMALSLILYSNRRMIEMVISDLGGNQENGFTFYITTKKEIESNIDIEIKPIKSSEPTPASITETGVPWDQPQPPTVLVIHDNYETIADFMENPGNKAFVWLLMIVHGAFISHCVHKSRESMLELSRKSREFCEAVLL